MRKLRALEDVLIRVESALAVVLVLTMLLLAAYNVVYRNVLVPLQQHWAHSGPPVEPAAASGVSIPAKIEKVEQVEKVEKVDGGDAKAETKIEAKSVDSAREEGADDFGGFGGGLDANADEPAPAVKAPETIAVAEPAKPAKAAGDDFGGFGGGLGEDEGEDEDEAEAGKAAGDDFAGFGGGLGDEGGEAEAGDAKAVGDAKATDAKVPAADDDELEEDDLGEDDLGDDDQFANLADIDAVAKKSADSIPQGGPPPAGSFAAWAVEFIDDIKLDWIDIFLRQLVIIVAFFGAMLATQRGKHINVDALSKTLPPGVGRVVGVVVPLAAVGVCLVLARAGWDLVSIGREYPKDLVPSVPEWSLQLMFPVGFGLLAVHFGVRVVEAAVAPPEPDPPPRSATPPPFEAHHEVDEVDDADDDDRGAAPQKGGR